MNATNDSEWLVVVAVRVPHNDGDDLTTSAVHRLEAVGDVRAVDVQELRDVEPALSATVVTLAVAIRTHPGLTVGTVERRLGDGPGVERVDELQRQ